MGHWYGIAGERKFSSEMRKLTTIILGAASLILSIVIYAVERSPQSGVGGSGHQLIRFDEKKVQTVTLSRGGQSVNIKRLGEHWFFTEPEAERINTNSMAALLDQLNHLLILDQLESSELVNEMAPANLGLVGDEALIVAIQALWDGKLKSDTIVIGRAASRSNSVYASIVNGKKVGGVSIVNGNPHEILDDPYGTLIERQLVNIPANGMDQVAIKTSRSGVVVQRKLIEGGNQTPWSIIQPTKTSADQARVEELIASLLALQISEKETMETAPVPIPNPLPDNSALIQFGILGSEKQIVLYLEKTPIQTDTFGPPLLTARISDRPGKYRLNSQILDSLNLTTTSLRDRRLGKIPESVLESIAIRREIPAAEVFLKPERKPGGVNWNVLINERWISANDSQINRLIQEMDKPVILDFVENAKLADYGITKEAALELRFNFRLPGQVKPDGSVGESEIFTKVLRLGWLPGESKRLFGNFLGETNIYELPPGFASLIPTHPIKWKSLRAMNFERWNLRGISKETKGQPKIELEYMNNLGIWKATSGGVDVSNQLDNAMADSLRDRLSSLKAVSWNLNVAEAYKLLEIPDTIFTIKTEELDPATNEVVLKTSSLRLVESGGFVHGQVDDSPDLFIMDREKYKQLLKPLTSFVPN